MHSDDTKIIRWITNILIFIIGFNVFYFSAHLQDCNDICQHNKYIIHLNEGKLPINGHFLYFLLISVLSGFSTDYIVISIIAAIVLSLMLIIKRQITEWIILCLVNIKNTKHPPFYGNLIHIISVLLILNTNLPAKPPYTGLWPPITWINSTTIFSFPICLYLFWYSQNIIIHKNFSSKKIIRIILLSLIIILSKPSYIFVFIITYPIYTMLHIKNKYHLLKTFSIIFVLLFIIGIQYYYYYYYYLPKYNTLNYQNIKITIEPFNAWARISRNISASFILWFCLPLMILVFYHRQLLKNKMYIYALLQFLTGLLIFILFEERTSDGKIYGSVNFMWQLIITLHIISAISVGFAIKYFQENENNIKAKIFFLIILLIIVYQTLSFIAYINNTIFKII